MRKVMKMYIGLNGKAYRVLPGHEADPYFVIGKNIMLEDEHKKNHTAIDIDELNMFYNKIKELHSNQSLNLQFNCKNCGAPLTSNRCEYCGTKY